MPSRSDAAPRELAIRVRDAEAEREVERAARREWDERLAGLDRPALVVRGEHDPVVPQRWAGEAARFARCEPAVVDGAGHAAPYERPHEVARLVVARARSV
jgi:pimeloyl-ACP methyl ester carboxylesterase